MSGPIVLGLRMLLALALYAFLGTALWMMWQDIRRTSDQISSRKAPPIRLEVRAKRRRPLVRAFAQPEIILGRDPAADLPLTDRAVSAHHALLSFHDGQWWVDDLGSRNGTRLNHEKVTGPTVLTNGDEIKCGQIRVVVTLERHVLDSIPSPAGEPDA